MPLPSPRSMRRSTLLLVAGAAAWLAALVLPFVSDPLTRVHEDPHHFHFARLALETGDLWHLVTDYVNHPPLINALAYGLLATVGGADPVHRVLPVTAFLVSAGVLTLLARELDAPEPWAGVPGVVFLFLPMTGYYWRRTGYEMVTVAFALALVVLYLRWADEATPGRAAAVLLLSVLGALSDWGYPLYAGAVFLDGWLLRPSRGRRRLGTAAAGGATLGVLVFWGLVLAGGASLDPLWDRLLAEGGGTELGPFLAVAELALWNVQMFTAVGVVLLVGPWVLAARRGGVSNPFRRERLRENRVLAALVLLGLPAVLYVVLFRTGAVNHRFWQLYLGPLLATGVLALGPLAPEGPGLGRGELETLAAVLAAAAVVAGAVLAGYYALAWNVPSLTEAFDHVDDEAGPDAAVLLADSLSGKKGRWYIDDGPNRTVDRYGATVPEAGAEAWVVYVEEERPLDFAGTLRGEGYGLEATFPSENLAAQWEVHVWRRGPAS